MTVTMIEATGVKSLLTKLRQCEDAIVERGGEGRSSPEFLQAG